MEDGVIAELEIERAAAKGTVGNIVLGKVTRVLPGMQAAFIDVGMERAAFLHVEDLIRPDDFEAYLSGDVRDDHQTSARGTGKRTVLGQSDADDDDDDDDDDDGDDSDVDADDDDDDDDADADADADDSDADADDPDVDADDPDVDAEVGTDGSTGSEAEAAADEGDKTADSEPPASPDGGTEASHEDDGGVRAKRAARPRRRRLIPSAPPPPPEGESALADTAGNAESASESHPPTGNEEDGDDAPKPTDEEPEDERETGPAEAAATPQPTGDLEAAIADDGDPEPAQTGDEGAASDGDDDRGRRARRRRRKKRPIEEPQAPTRSAEPRGRESRGKKRRRGRPVKKPSSRVSRSVPITEVVKEGDEVIVQISKEPIGTKGARVTSHVSLPGRYVVYLPTVEHVGISKRIGSSRERGRLREVMESLKPQRGGLIVRTVAEGLTKKNLKADVGYLIKLWSEISRKRDGAKSPSVLYTELDLVLKTARDAFTYEIEKIVIDDKEQHARLVRFVEMFLPERVKDIELYQGREPLFDAYGIEDEIGRALSRKVPLPSGGYLIIDQAEALSAIDVNTGRYVGKGSKDLEETALKTNLEAVEEIAYQLRFRNIGGLIILDLIDMDSPSNRDKVYRELERQLSRDKAKTTINRISELGLIEMTRKRTRESLSRTLHEPCFYCDGTGQIMSRTTIAYEILRQIRRELEMLPGYCVVVNAHPAIVDLLQGDEHEAVEEAERRYMRRIELNACREYHIEQFDLQGR